MLFVSECFFNKFFFYSCLLISSVLFVFQVYSMHQPETISFDAVRLRRLCKHHFGSTCCFSNYTRGKCSIQRLATIDSTVRRERVLQKIKSNVNHFVCVFFNIRSKSCKKDLWAQINTVLQNNSK